MKIVLLRVLRKREPGLLMTMEEKSLGFFGLWSTLGALDLEWQVMHFLKGVLLEKTPRYLMAQAKKRRIKGLILSLDFSIV